MLSPAEKAGCSELLRLLDLEDVISLKNTVSKACVVAESLDEAISIIIMFSESADELLRRQKVKRDLIYRYLAEKGVVEDPTLDKPRLITRVLSFWNNGPGVISKKSPVKNPETQPKAPSPPLEDQFSSDFVAWFFPMINKLYQDPCYSEFGAFHFLPDTKITIHQASSDADYSEEALGAAPVADLLRNFLHRYKILLNPNPQGGVQIRTSPHGLMQLVVCGTIHDPIGQYLGTFEQATELVRDPTSQNNYKIQMLYLNLKTTRMYEHAAIEGRCDALMEPL